MGVIFFEDVVTGSLIVEAGLDLLAHADWQPGFDEVWDLRLITEFAISPEDMKAIVTFEETYAERIGHGRACVISNRFYVRALHRLFGALTRNRGRAQLTCATHEEAATTLGIDPTVLAP